MLSNRRRHPRIPIDTSIRIRVDGKDFFPLKAFNISMGGMCIHVGQRFEKGKKGKLFLSQQCPGELIEFEARFKILWVDTQAPGCPDLFMGLEFIKMKRKHQENLLKLLRIQGAAAGQ